MNSGLKNLLEGLNLLSSEAVFFRNEKDGGGFSAFSVDTENKLEIIKPDAYFVFNKQPYVLFFDLTGIISKDREIEIHQQVWSFDYSPVIFIVKSADIEIFNAFSFDKKLNRLKEIKISPDERNEIFSFWNLQSGDAWRWLQAEQYNSASQKKRVNQKLFENIKSVREILIDTGNGLSEDEANILVLRLIFIRYLIDRDVRMDNEYISGNKIADRRKGFIELVKKPQKLNDFFAQLNTKFNGVLFKDIKVELTKTQAETLGCIFSGTPDPTQLVLFDSDDFYFEIFDFSIIPVEVISGIYESLINQETRNEQSAVYTPSFLVEYILNDTIDKFLVKGFSECKVFDPSCGSGIFLVQSYRRMVDRAIALNKDIRKTRLREIAEKNLFGIDLNPQALKVACFSVYIAMLDYQDPKTILDNFRFPKLIDENFFEANFFDEEDVFNDTVKGKEIDFILGNPPWKSTKEEKHLRWLRKHGKKTGRYEIAQSFLLRSKDFMKPNTKAALIVTSTIFYNVSDTTKGFKQEFLTQFFLDSFFDLSPVRRLVFEKKNNPASIVFFRASDGKNHLDNIVQHKSIKWNMFLKYYRTLIIEKFDQKQILQRHFLENDWMFKVALYGNVLDYSFLMKLACNRQPLLNLFDGKSLFKGAGIHKGNIDDHNSFAPIIGKPIIENSEVKKYYSASNSDNRITEEESHIKSGTEEGLFQGLQILIKEQAKHESEIVISLTDKEYIFRSGVFGLATTDRKHELYFLYALLISDLYQYFIFITSGSWGVSTRPQIRLDDEYLSFPYSEPSPKALDKLLKLVSRNLQSYKDHHERFLLGSPHVEEKALRELNDIISSMYKVERHETDLIDYVLNISRYQFQESKQQQFLRRIDNDRPYLEAYINVFLRELEGLYEREQLIVEVFPLNHFIALNFMFTDNRDINSEVVVYPSASSEKDILQRIAGNLSISKIVNSADATKNIFVQKDIKGFEENSFYIVKPNEYKCWHRAMAWYDVAEIREAIEQAELRFIKQE